MFHHVMSHIYYTLYIIYCLGDMGKEFKGQRGDKSITVDVDMFDFLKLAYLK